MRAEQREGSLQLRRIQYLALASLGSARIVTSKPVAMGCEGGTHHPKSANRFTFTHKVDKKLGFCGRVKGEVQEAHFWGPKSPLVWSLAPP